jgi:secondary thiamine-phosphate synthase enzyme
MERFEISTRQRTEWRDITPQVRELVGRRGARQGIVVVFCPHTTAAITINENADPDVVHDVLAWLDRAIPQQQPDFRHDEGNSDAHLKASLIGSSVTVLLADGDLVLGRWQGIFSANSMGRAAAACTCK